MAGCIFFLLLGVLSLQSSVVGLISCPICCGGPDLTESAIGGQDSTEECICCDVPEVYIPCIHSQYCPVGYHCCGSYGCWKDGTGCPIALANTTSQLYETCDNGTCPPNSSCCENECCPSNCHCGCWGCWCPILGIGPVCPVNAPSCPVLKTVGDTCYERVEDSVDTSSYGCSANCTYKKIKNDGSEDEIFCFASGGFRVDNYKCQNTETYETGTQCGGNCALDYHCGPSCPDCLLMGEDWGRCVNKSGVHCGGNCAKDYHCGPSCPTCLINGASGQCIISSVGTNMTNAQPPEPCSFCQKVQSGDQCTTNGATVNCQNQDNVDCCTSGVDCAEWMCVGNPNHETLEWVCNRDCP